MNKQFLSKPRIRESHEHFSQHHCNAKKNLFATAFFRARAAYLGSNEPNPSQSQTPATAARGLLLCFSGKHPPMHPSNLAHSKWLLLDNKHKQIIRKNWVFWSKRQVILNDWCTQIWQHWTTDTDRWEQTTWSSCWENLLPFLFLKSPVAEQSLKISDLDQTARV